MQRPASDHSPAVAGDGQALLVSQVIDSGGKTIAHPSGLPPNAQALQYTNRVLDEVQAIWTQQNLVCDFTVVPRPRSPSLAQIVGVAAIQERKAQATVSG
jgi:hypothetical protein